MLIDGIPPTQRSIELIVPPSPPSSNNALPVLRVVAVDDAGQEGRDEAMFATPYIDFAGTLTPAPIFGEFRPGEIVDVCYTFSGGVGGTVDAYLFVDGNAWAFSLGGAHTGVNCLPLGLTIPPVSTDLARVGIRFNYGAGGRNAWEFTNYFSIRPDPAIVDAPPTVQVLTPQPGQSFPGGSVVPITWTAGDDEGLRSFDIQASYDGGRTRHVVARDLPPSATGFNWNLPASSGISDARVRVAAWDLRFENSSGASGAFVIAPGVLLPPGDIDGDGDVDMTDHDLFVGVLLGSSTNPDHVARSDLNGDVWPMAGMSRVSSRPSCRRSRRMAIVRCRRRCLRVEHVTPDTTQACHLPTSGQSRVGDLCGGRLRLSTSQPTPWRAGKKRTQGRGAPPHVHNPPRRRFTCRRGASDVTLWSGSGPPGPLPARQGRGVPGR